MITLLIIVLLIIIAAISKSVMDTVSFRFTESIFSNFKNQNWWNPSISWKNKYKNQDPKQGPKFFGSTTFLVFITDAWHFFQMIMLSCFNISIILGINHIIFNDLNVCRTILLDMSLFIILHFIFGIVFELFWDKLFIK